MHRTILTACGILILGVASATAQTTPPASAKMTSAECQALWTKANLQSTGSLTQTQAQGYVIDFSVADTDKDSKLSNAEFLSACQRGMVRDTAASGAGTGGSGSGSTKN